MKKDKSFFLFELTQRFVFYSEYTDKMYNINIFFTHQQMQFY